MFSIDKYQESADFIKKQIGTREPKLLVVLGSGLGYLAQQCEDRVTVPYNMIPYFQQTTVAGHAGTLTFGTLGGRDVMLMQGRMHMYEGNSPEQSAFAVGVSHLLGVKVVILTNASGGVNLDFQAGDLMLIRDQINFSQATPLWGENCEELGTRFPDMSEAYSLRLQAIARESAQQTGVALREGVYFYMRGPQYETPAEIRAIRTLGGDAVGMSSVNEAIAAAHCRMEVLGLSLITNLASGVSAKTLSHEEVTAGVMQSQERFTHLLLHIIKNV